MWVWIVDVSTLVFLFSAKGKNYTRYDHSIGVALLFGILQNGY